MPGGSNARSKMLPLLRRCGSFIFPSRRTSPSGEPVFRAISSLTPRPKPCTTSAGNKTMFEANIVRILGNEIEYQLEHVPPGQPETSFNSFSVHDRPGEPWIVLRSSFDDDEDVELQVSMFDGYITVPKHGEDACGDDLLLLVSFLVSISKRGRDGVLEFACTALPNRFEIHHCYLISDLKTASRKYIGPRFSTLNVKKNRRRLEKSFLDFLEARGVNDELVVFLHRYLMNKDRSELLGWLGKVKHFVEK